MKSFSSQVSDGNDFPADFCVNENLNLKLLHRNSPLRDVTRETFLIPS